MRLGRGKFCFFLKMLKIENSKDIFWFDRDKRERV